MIWLYRVLFPLLLVVAAPHYLWRMRRRGGYGAGFAQRFGVLPPVPAKRPGVTRLWLHAVSVGEMLAVGPLIEAWTAPGADTEVWLTTTTSTGYALARERYGARVVGVAYFPIDWWPVMARVWRRVRPDLAVLAEGERWPEHMAQAKRRRVPLVCLNGRLSDRSYGRLRALGWLGRWLLRPVDRLLAVSEHDAARFRELGYPPERLSVTGNIKLDAPIPALDAAALAQLRREVGFDDAGGVPSPAENASDAPRLPRAEERSPAGNGLGAGASIVSPVSLGVAPSFTSTCPALAPDDARLAPLPDADAGGARSPSLPPLVILGSSTWPGEEAALLDTLRAARATTPRAEAASAATPSADSGLPAGAPPPRSAGARPAASAPGAAGIREAGRVRLLLVPRHAERRGELEALLAGSGFSFHFRSRGPAPGPVDVAVGDTTGELRALTQLADVVFVGKSLPPHDGGQTPVEAAALARAVLFGPHMSNFRPIVGELTAGGAARVVSTPGELAEATINLLADNTLRAQMGAAGRAWHQASQGAVSRTLQAVRELQATEIIKGCP